MNQRNLGFEKDQTVIFLHIAKTAGTTFMDRIIKPQFHPDAIYESRTYRPISELKKFPEKQKAKIKVLMGHFGYGWHRFLSQPSTYVTIFRDPVDRVISYYYFVRQYSDDPLRKEAQKMGLKDFVSSGISIQLDNGQTRLISGIDNGPDETDVGFGHCSADHLELAKKNMREHFSFVGFTERFNESMILSKRLLGWDAPFYIKKKVNRDRLSKKDIPNSTLKCIEKYNELDIKLYKAAKEMYEEQVIQQGQTFKKDLILYNTFNKCYNFYLPVNSRIRKLRYKIDLILTTPVRSFIKKILNRSS